MDNEIKKDNPEVSNEDVMNLLDYKPITTVKPDVIDDRTLSFTESSLETRLKKIRDEADKYRTPYPWEQEEVIFERKPEEKKEYVKQVYTVQPSNYRQSYSGKSKTTSTYIITAQDASLDQSQRPVDNSPLGTPTTYKQKYGNYTYTFTTQGRNRIHGRYYHDNVGKDWSYAILPGTEHIKDIGARLDKVHGKNRPGEKNGYLPNSVLAEAPGAVGKNNRLHIDCIASWNLMRAAAKKEGINLIPYSCYRNYARQLELWNNRGSSKGRVAPPGKSNHGLGRAMDIGAGGGSENIIKQRKWMTNNGHKYGWFWGDAPTENWHFVYCW